jgi:GPH family glycoside/pentoside/hexuronide:cation symporter
MTEVVEDTIQLSLPETGGTPLSRSEKLGFRTKTVYGSGALVENVINTVLTNFHLFYMTAVCGLSGTIFGFSAFLALAINALVDPFVGSLSDNTRSRLGRRHPYMIVAALPITVTFGLLFTMPPSFSGPVLFFYSTAILLLMRFGLSTFVIPYMAMGGELSDDYHERSIVVAFRHSFGIIAGIVPALIGLPLFLRGSNVLSRAAYVPYAWTCAAIVLAGALASSLGSLNTLGRLYRAGEASGDPFRRFVREIAEVARNRSFLILMGALIFFFIAQGAAGVLTLHATKFFWKLPNNVIAAFQIAVPVGMAVGIPIITLIARKLEKRTIVLGGQITFCLLQFSLPVLRIAGVLPANGPLLNAILVGDAFVIGVVVTALVIGFQSMMADAADEHDLLFGARREGIYFAGLSFAVKMTAGAGVLVGGIALDVIGFPTGIVSRADAMVQLLPATERNLGLIAGPLPALITLVCVLITWFYRIDRARHAVIRDGIDARNSQGGSSS